jgi:hypothetical protein
MTEVAEKKTIIVKLDFAYAVIRSNMPGQRIGLVKLGETGYYPAEGYDCANDTIKQVEDRVKELNDRIGVPSEVGISATGSMFGWDVPGAQVAIRFFNEESEVVEPIGEHLGE